MKDATMRDGTSYRGLVSLVRDGPTGGAMIPMGTLVRPPLERAFAVRHDIDSRLDHAVEFARFEADLGVRATYYLLHTAPYWTENPKGVQNAARTIEKLGHQVGLHNDAVSQHCVHVCAG